MTFWDIYRLFPRNRIWHSVQIVLVRRHFLWNVKAKFLGKIIKKYFKMSSAEFAHKVVKVKGASSVTGLKEKICLKCQRLFLGKITIKTFFLTFPRNRNRNVFHIFNRNNLKCQSLFSGNNNNKRKYFKMSSAEFVGKVIKVKSVN